MGTAPWGRPSQPPPGTRQRGQQRRPPWPPGRGPRMFLYWKKRGAYELGALPPALAGLEYGAVERFSWSSSLDITEELAGRSRGLEGCMAAAMGLVKTLQALQKGRGAGVGGDGSGNGDAVAAAGEHRVSCPCSSTCTRLHRFLLLQIHLKL